MLVGVDAGSSYIKVVVMDDDGSVVEHRKMPSLARQGSWYQDMLDDLRARYRITSVAACGYGRGNVRDATVYSELVALAAGVQRSCPGRVSVIDIGGMDTKCVVSDGGRLADFVLNDKCASAAGSYLSMALERLEIAYDELSVARPYMGQVEPMSTHCAVYAQADIVTRIGQGESPAKVLAAVIDAVLRQTSSAFRRLGSDAPIVFTGGLSSFDFIGDRLSQRIGLPVSRVELSEYLCAYGAAKLSVSASTD